MLIFHVAHETDSDTGSAAVAGPTPVTSSEMSGPIDTTDQPIVPAPHV